MMSIGRDGLVVSVRGSHAMKVTIKVQAMAETFLLQVNLRRNTIPSRRPKTSICGRVRPAAESATHAQKGMCFSANHTAASTKNRLMTWVCPQTDMLNQTAGLKSHSAVATRLHL